MPDKFLLSQVEEALVWMQQNKQDYSGCHEKHDYIMAEFISGIAHGLYTLEEATDIAKVIEKMEDIGYSYYTA